MQIYLIQNGQQIGPYTVDEVRGMLAAQSITLNDQGWHEGLAGWQPLNTFLPNPSPQPISPPPIPSVTPAPDTDASAAYGQPFGSWYQPKFAKMSGGKRALVWIFYGFIWIPLWWLISTTRASALSSEKPPLTGIQKTWATYTQSFLSWYRTKMGDKPVFKQWLAWFCFGSIWIPLWWGFSKGSPPKAKWVLGGVMAFAILVAVFGDGSGGSSSMSNDPAFRHGFMSGAAMARKGIVEPSNEQIDAFARYSINQMTIPDDKRSYSIWAWKEGFGYGWRHGSH